MSALAGSTYELRVREHLDGHWSALLADLSITHNDDGTTTLTGQVRDQAQLYGVLGCLRDLGITLLSLRTLHHR